ncbi:anti-sigma factor family protein [Saccharothrix lopnurensis]|uniref:Anti-sigma factor family protein n=1 Tax=Saccharothrix lopnurensis TaxID=1670621 RepID=A0ABW1PC85_9PSEU
MSGDPFRESLGAFVLGQLGEPERIAVQAHVDGCPACRAEVADLRPAVELLGLADPSRVSDAPAVPAGLGESVLARIRAERRPRRAPRRAALVAAAVLIAVSAGGIGYAVGRPTAPLEPVAVAGSAPGVSARAALVPHTWGMEIKLEATGFTPGRAYRVLVRDRAGRQSPAGGFVGTGTVPMTCNLNSSVLRRDAAGFTVLDAGDAGGAVALAADF